MRDSIAVLSSPLFCKKVRSSLSVIGSDICFKAPPVSKVICTNCSSGAPCSIPNAIRPSAIAYPFLFSVLLSPSHHPMTRKHLPRRTIERCRGEPCIDRGVLNVGVSQPVLHKREISASIKQVCRNRMLQAVGLPLLSRQVCDLAIRLHKVVQHVASNRYASIRDKEIGRLICTRP